MTPACWAHCEAACVQAQWTGDFPSNDLSDLSIEELRGWHNNPFPQYLIPLPKKNKYNIYTSGPPFVSFSFIFFVRGSILKFLLDHMCSTLKCSNFWSKYSGQARNELHPFARYGDQVSQIPANLHVEKSIDSKLPLTFFQFAVICGNVWKCAFVFAEICARSAGCNLYSLGLDPKKMIAFSPSRIG